MSKLKVYMTEKNYVAVDGTHIFINFTRNNLNMLNEINPDTIDKVIIFITNHASINESVKILIERFGKKLLKQIQINLPQPVESLKVLAEKFLGVEDEVYSLQVVDEVIYFPTEISGVMNDHLISFTPTVDRLIIKINEYNVMGVDLNFPQYPYNVVEEEQDGIFETPEMRLDPMQFKDILIAKFKEKAPEGILKSFKNDDEIMEYILQSGEWAVKEDDDKKDGVIE